MKATMMAAGRPSGRLARVAVATVVALCVATSARAETGLLNVHLEGGGATFLKAPQTGYFGFGGSAAAAFEWSIVDKLGLEAEYVFAGFSRGTGEFSRPNGQVHLIGLGARFRPLNDSAGFLGHVGKNPDWHQGNLHGDLWLAAHIGYVRTGALDRLGFDAALGYELSLVDGFSAGPYARYLHIVQPNGDPLDTSDALALSFGVAGTFCLTTCSVHVPPPDSDGDGVPDRIDRCPNEAEDMDGFQDQDGCPDLDNDGDGVPDRIDRCPNEAEDMDGFQDEDGCPDPDNDGDTILDPGDKCPNEAEDMDGFQDEDGCPDPDNDGDTILDRDDKCPNEAEVVNGVDDTDGCPDEALAHVEANRIVIKDMVHFEFGTATLRRDSLPVVRDVARLILAHPEYERIAIEGHTDYQGAEKLNVRLSQQRAEQIRRTLIQMGVTAERLTATGLGAANPVAAGRNIDANRRNRRVEFVITQIRR